MCGEGESVGADVGEEGMCFLRGRAKRNALGKSDLQKGDERGSWKR